MTDEKETPQNMEEAVIQARYNEPFPINFDPQSDFAVANTLNLKTQRISLKADIDGHPGFKVEVSNPDTHSIDREVHTVVPAVITLNPRYDLIADTHGMRQKWNGISGQNFFMPFGPASIRLRMEINQKGELDLFAKDPPYDISIFLIGVRDPYHGNDADLPKIFLIHGDQVIEASRKYTYDDKNVKDHAISQKQWVDARSRQNNDGTLLLPGDPKFFEEFRILVGDKAPEIV